MYRPLTEPSRRRGVILLVVLLLLTLFAVLGLSLVIYADAEARSARLQGDALRPTKADGEPELLFAYFLGQLIYDAADDNGLYSALRGHSLGRTIYGSNDGPAANLVPYSGVGRLRAPTPFGTQVPGPALTDDQLINYTFYPDDSQLPPAQRFLRDPERPGWRPPDPAAPRGPYTGGLNAPYTYPDLNSTFLAAVRADGTVLLPSFHRPWAAAVSGFPNAGEFHDRDTGQLNPLWSPAAQPPPWFKYTTLRPLPALNPGFPPPEDGGGDVKNLIGGPGTFRRLNPSTGRPEYWSNDSFWMDLGSPVLTAPDGRKYKALFAALIVDLDGRVNLNVHGNVAGADNRHRSNQGWGPWEVNLGHVLTEGDEWRNLLQGSAAPAWPGRHGGAAWAGRFGTPGAPAALAPGGALPHFYGQVDFDGYNEVAGGPSGRLLLPGLGGPPLLGFPSYLSPAGTYAGYGNRSAAERLGHPLLASAFRPAGDDRTFAASNLEALLRPGDTGSPALASELLRLCPLNFRNPRTRGLVTTHSFDLDRPGVSPWVHFHERGTAYEAPPVTDPDRPPAPAGQPTPFPALANRGLPPLDRRLDHGDFGGPDWRALSAALGRVNLNRPLPPYPHQGSGTAPPFGRPLTVVSGRAALDLPFSVDAPDGPIWKQFVRAQEARQRLAEDLYRRLLAVTGVPPLLPDQNPQEPPEDLLRPRRWLAQLAANIVDYVDEDDISTPFNFYTVEDYRHLPAPPALPPDPGRVDPERNANGPDGDIQWPLHWVFGTELPRVVVNEALAQMKQNDPDEAYEDTVRVFVELHNPLPRTLPGNVHAPDGFPVPLRMGAAAGGYAPYRVLVSVKSPSPDRVGGAAILPGVGDDNVLGNPDPEAVRTATTDADFLRPLASAGAGPQPDFQAPAPYAPIPSPHLPAHGPDDDATPQGFVLLGPPEAEPEPFATHDPLRAPNNAGIPRATPVLRTARLEYARGFQVRTASDPPDERAGGVTVVLRRLANPYLPFDGRRRVRTAPNFTYNPYVTVDYLEDVPVQPVETDVRPPLAARGKLQPYAARRELLQAQASRSGPNLNASFGRANIPASERHDWLTHLDRPLVSPLELLHVSGCQPYQLTQRFLTLDDSDQPVKFGHLAPWLDPGRPPGAPSHRLYRLFEFVTAGAPGDGAPGGRVSGKINLNTVWEPEVFRALGDAQPSNYFQDADVDALFGRFLYDPTGARPASFARRTPGLVPGPDDRPFRGLAPGTYPPGDGQSRFGGGVEDTFLRLMPPSGGIHPYLDAELLTKIANNVTTRSNVFAVWLTVGFFEVTDDTTRPVRLGVEVGRAENRHVRHRMFAVIDRTNLSIASCVTALTGPVAPPPLPHPFPLAPITVPVQVLRGGTPARMAGPNVPWRIQPGTVLVVGVGAEQETVEVLAVDAHAVPPTITAIFTKPHAVGTALSLAHTPGPPPVFLKPAAVTGPDPAPLPPYVVAVHVPVDPSRSGASVLAGTYDGTPWTIRPGTRLLLDVGPNQEAVTVLPGPFALDPAAGTGAFRVVVARPHADDLLISNTLLGNPGPQPGFNPRDPVFAGLVRHLSIID